MRYHGDMPTHNPQHCVNPDARDLPSMVCPKCGAQTIPVGGAWPHRCERCQMDWKCPKDNER